LLKPFYHQVSEIGNHRKRDALFFSAPAGLLAFGSFFRAGLPDSFKRTSDLGFNQYARQSPITATGSPRIRTAFRNAGFSVSIVVNPQKTSFSLCFYGILPKPGRIFRLKAINIHFQNGFPRVLVG